MNAFALKQNQVRKHRSPDLQTSANVQFQPQRTFGNHALSRVSEPQQPSANAGVGTSRTPRIWHDFSRIPVHYQASVTEASAEDVTPLAPTLRAQIDQQAGNGHPLDPRVRQTMEASFGADLSRVRLHTDPAATRSASQLNAVAFTRGYDIFFAGDTSKPASAPGLSVLMHELTHVLQRRTGLGVQRQPLAMPTFSRLALLMSDIGNAKTRSQIVQYAPQGSKPPPVATPLSVSLILQQGDPPSHAQYQFTFNAISDGVNLWNAYVSLTSVVRPNRSVTFSWTAKPGAAPSALVGMQFLGANLAPAITFEVEIDFAGAIKPHDTVTFAANGITEVGKAKAHREFVEVTGDLRWLGP